MKYHGKREKLWPDRVSTWEKHTVTPGDLVTTTVDFSEPPPNSNGAITFDEEFLEFTLTEQMGTKIRDYDWSLTCDFYFKTGELNNDNYVLYMYPLDVRFTTTDVALHNGGVAILTYANTNLNENEWNSLEITHVAGTNTIEMKVNEVSAGTLDSTAAPFNINSSTGTAYVGSALGTASKRLTCSLSNFVFTMTGLADSIAPNIDLTITNEVYGEITLTNKATATGAALVMPNSDPDSGTPTVDRNSGPDATITLPMQATIHGVKVAASQQFPVGDGTINEASYILTGNSNALRTRFILAYDHNSESEPTFTGTATDSVNALMIPFTDMSGYTSAGTVNRVTFRTGNALLSDIYVLKAPGANMVGTTVGPVEVLAKETKGLANSGNVSVDFPDTAFLDTDWIGIYLSNGTFEKASDTGDVTSAGFYNFDDSTLNESGTITVKASDGTVLLNKFAPPNATPDVNEYYLALNNTIANKVVVSLTGDVSSGELDLYLDVSYPE